MMVLFNIPPIYEENFISFIMFSFGELITITYWIENMNPLFCTF